MFSAALRCGLIEAFHPPIHAGPHPEFSAALRCGLIEASVGNSCSPTRSGRFPQHYAAASLKHLTGARIRTPLESFPQHYAAASLKQPGPAARRRYASRFPQHYAAASLKLVLGRDIDERPVCFPQHYAAASLKLVRSPPGACGSQWFSAALRCGLIEAAGSIVLCPRATWVFRSITLRPH